MLRLGLCNHRQSEVGAKLVIVGTWAYMRARLTETKSKAAALLH